MEEVYQDGKTPVNSKQAPGEKKARQTVSRLNKASITLAAARDSGLSKGAHQALDALMALAGDRDAVDVSDDLLAALMSSPQRVVSPAAVRGLLARLEAGGYVDVDRKRKACADRHIALRNPFEGRGKGQENQENAVQENPEKARRICTKPAQIPTAKKEKKETPKRSKRESLNQESLDSFSLSSDSLNPASESLDPDLAALAAQYGPRHYHPDVVQAAYALNDLQGLPHYDNTYRFLALGDQDIWAEGVERTITYVRGSGVESPRRFLGVCIQDVLEAKAQRDRLLGPRPAPESGPGPAEAAWDIMDDPFVDAAPVVAPDPEPVAPEPVAEPDVAPDPEPAAPDPEPVAGPVIHPAVAEAMQTLGLQVAVEEVQSVFDGACRGRESLFSLVVSAMTGAAVRSPIAFMCKIADEHKGKDDAYCLDRASGMTVAERMEALKAWEAHLEAEKQALNPPLTCCGGFRSDVPQDLKPLLGGIMDQATKTASAGVPAYLGSVTLPDSPRECSALEEAMGQMRDAYLAADPSLQAAVNAAGIALAHARAARAEKPEEWERWRRAGVYHAFQALRQTAVRAEAVRRDQARQDAPEPTGREDPDIFEDD